MSQQEIEDLIASLEQQEAELAARLNTVRERLKRYRQAAKLLEPPEQPQPRGPYRPRPRGQGTQRERVREALGEIDRAVDWYELQQEGGLHDLNGQQLQAALSHLKTEGIVQWDGRGPHGHRWRLTDD